MRVPGWTTAQRPHLGSLCREKHSGDVEISTQTGARNITPNIHVNIPYSTGFPSVKCLPLEMSLKWHEDVTADFGIALDPSQMG